MRAMRWLTLLLLILTQNLYALDLSKLDREQRDKLFKGEFVLLAHEVQDNPWPRLEIFKFVDSDPLSIAAFFADFEEQTEYVPELVKAKIVNSKPLDVQVAYEMNLPWPVPNAVYTHGHHLSSPAKDQYKVEWYLVSSTVAEAVNGHAEFIGQDGRTLWHYEALVRPKSALAGLFVGTMKSDTIKSLSATLNAFELWRREKPVKLKQSVERWQKRFKNSTN